MNIYNDAIENRRFQLGIKSLLRNNDFPFGGVINGKEYRTGIVKFSRIPEYNFISMTVFYWIILYKVNFDIAGCRALFVNGFPLSVTRII